MFSIYFDLPLFKSFTEKFYHDTEQNKTRNIDVRMPVLYKVLFEILLKVFCTNPSGIKLYFLCEITICGNIFSFLAIKLLGNEVIVFFFSYKIYPKQISLFINLQYSWLLI